MNDTIIIVDQALIQVNTLHNTNTIDSARLTFLFHSRVQRKSASCTSPKDIKTWDKFAQTFTLYSLLISIPGFDITRRVAIDYMHGTLLGVVKMLVNLWSDEQHRDQPWYTGKCERAVEKIYVTIKQPSCISRLPRSLIGNVVTSRLHNFGHFYFYSLPC